MDPVGPVRVAAPGGKDSFVVYGDKSSGHISVQLYKSESTGGTRKVKDLLLEELTLREHDDVHYTGVKLVLRFITSDSEAKLITDGVENVCGDRSITHLKSPPRSHRYNFIEGRMKTLVSKALSAFHYSGYPLMFFIRAFVHGAAAINMLTTTVRGDESDKFKTPFERRFKSGYPTPPICTRLERRYTSTQRRRSALSIVAEEESSTTSTLTVSHPTLMTYGIPTAWRYCTGQMSSSMCCTRSRTAWRWGSSSRNDC
jgi:hypothetical protein